MRSRHSPLLMASRLSRLLSSYCFIQQLRACQRFCGSMQYQQRDLGPQTHEPIAPNDQVGAILKFRSTSQDISFDEIVFDKVGAVWSKIMEPESESSEFLHFPDREGEADEDGDED